MDSPGRLRQDVSSTSRAKKRATDEVFGSSAYGSGADVIIDVAG